ncbi:MAG: hypothetical protein ACRDNL_03210 [Spirillospora sp.]
MHLLNAFAHVGDWGEAEPVLTEVAGTAGDVGSTRTTNLLARVADRIVRAGALSTVTGLAGDVRHRVRQAGAR